MLEWTPTGSSLRATVAGVSLCVSRLPSPTRWYFGIDVGGDLVFLAQGEADNIEAAKAGAVKALREWALGLAKKLEGPDGT